MASAVQCRAVRRPAVSADRQCCSLVGGSQLEIHFNNGSSGHHHQGRADSVTKKHVPRNILLLIHRNSDDSSLRMKIFLATGEFLPNIPPWSAGTLGTVECRSRSLLGLGTRQVSSSAEPELRRMVMATLSSRHGNPAPGNQNNTAAWPPTAAATSATVM